VQCVSGVLSPDVNRLERESDRSPPRGTEVKNECICNYTLHSAFTHDDEMDLTSNVTTLIDWTLKPFGRKNSIWCINNYSIV
jgi:hypothetical protein